MTVISRLASMGIDVRTRAEWGTRYEALYQQRRQDKPVSLPVPYAFSHISVTVDDGTLIGDFDSDMRELERIGYERFQSGISYNWAIDAVTGMIGEGQPLDAKGTHTVNDLGIPGFPTNLNYYGHAVVCIGMPGVQPTAAFQHSFAAILRAEWDEGVMVRDAPIYPHSKFANKDCPTENIRILLPNILKLAQTWNAVLYGKDLNVATLADLAVVIRQELKTATLDGGVFYEVVQAFSGWNAENLRQRIDDIGNFAANATDLAVKDDFAALEELQRQVEGQVQNLVNAVTALAAKLPIQS